MARAMSDAGEARARTSSGESTAGVRELEHTADVGLDVQAPTLPALFERAAGGLVGLLYGAAPPPLEATVRREVSVQAEDPARLLLLWLRELLYFHEAEGLVYRGARDLAVGEGRARATALLSGTTAPPQQEIKGVTYHGLAAERREDGWQARVIFDV